MIGRADRAYYQLERALVVICLALMSASVFVEVVHRRLVSRESAVSGLLLFAKKLSLRGKVRAELGEKAPQTRVEIEVVKRMRASRLWMDTHVAPPLTGALLFVLVLFAVRTARRVGDGSQRAPPGSAAAYLVALLLGAGVGMASLHVSSSAQWWLVGGGGAVVALASFVWNAGLGALGAAAAVASGLALLGKLMVSAPSRWTYVTIITVSALVLVKRAVQSGQRGRAAAAAVAALLFGFAAYKWVPEGFGWSKELSIKVLLMWVAFLGASMASHTRRHIMVDFMRKAVPERARPAYEGISALVAAGITGVLCYLAYLYVFGAEGASSIYGSEAMLEHSDVPAWLGMAAIPVGLFTTALRFVGTAVVAFRGELEVRDPLAVASGGATAEGEAEREGEAK